MPRACASGSRSRRGAARADPDVADALLRRRLPAAAVRGGARACAAGDRHAAPDGGARSSASCAPTARAPPPPRGSRPAARASSRGARPQTLGAEWMLALRVRLAAPARRHARDRPQRGLRLDAVPPPALDAAPGARRARRPGAARRRGEDRAAAARGARRRAAADQPAHPDDRPRALLRRLHRQVQPRPAARRARARACGSSPSTRSARCRAAGSARSRRYSGLAGVFDRVEVAFGREAAGLEVSRDDAFVATTWWTAHVAHAALRVGRRRALPLPDPGVRAVHVPDGQLRRAGRRSPTGFPHPALFSTELLRDFFRRADRRSRRPTSRGSATFENAITAVDAAVARRSSRPARRRLLVLRAARAARRAQHVRARHARAAAARSSGARSRRLGAARDRDRARRRAGSTSAAAPRCELLPRRRQADYGELLREHDVGLALMYTPHPSLVPIEMASAGMLAVTNTFENKTAEALAAISPNLVAAEPTIDGVAAALVAARRGGRRRRRRARGSPVAGAATGTTSFDDALIDRVIAVPDEGRRRRSQPRRRRPRGRALSRRHARRAARPSSSCGCCSRAAPPSLEGSGPTSSRVRHPAPSRVLHGAGGARAAARGSTGSSAAPTSSGCRRPRRSLSSAGVPLVLTLHDLSFVERPAGLHALRAAVAPARPPGALARRPRACWPTGRHRAARARARGLERAQGHRRTRRAWRSGPARRAAERVRRFGAATACRSATSSTSARSSRARRSTVLVAAFARPDQAPGRRRRGPAGGRVRGPGVHAAGPRRPRRQGRALRGRARRRAAVVVRGLRLPPLEGYAHGTPAIVSDLPSLRETAGAGALYVPPGDVEPRSPPR